MGNSGLGNYVDNDNFIMGNYIKLINQTYEDNLISEGKRDELLINSFNEDLINYIYKPIAERSSS